MKTFVLTALILTISSGLRAAGAAEPQPPAQPEEKVRERAEAIMHEWRTVNPDILRDPAKAQVLQRLRVEAKESHRDYARVPLLRMGDPEVVALCVREFRTKPFERGRVAQQLKLSGSPALIAVLAEDLPRDESTESVFIAPEFLERPVSVHAGDIIRSIIASSSEFSGPTKRWADSLSRQPSSRRDDVREEMRRWWLENKRLIDAKNYREVKPPSNSSFAEHQ